MRSSQDLFRPRRRTTDDFPETFLDSVASAADTAMQNVLEQDRAMRDLLRQQNEASA